MLTISVIALIMAPVSNSADKVDDDCGDGGVPTTYDPVELKAYFATRPVSVLKRQVGAHSLTS